MRNHYVVILNSETESVDVLSLDNMPDGEDIYDFIEGALNYNLSNCQWMVTTNFMPERLNF